MDVRAPNCRPFFFHLKQRCGDVIESEVAETTIYYVTMSRTIDDERLACWFFGVWQKRFMVGNSPPVRWSRPDRFLNICLMQIGPTSFLEVSMDHKPTVDCLEAMTNHPARWLQLGANTLFKVPKVAVLRVEDRHGMQLLDSSAKDVCSRVVLGKVLQTGCQVLYSGEPSWNPQCFGMVLEPPYHINESSNSCCGPTAFRSPFRTQAENEKKIKQSGARMGAVKWTMPRYAQHARSIMEHPLVN